MFATVSIKKNSLGNKDSVISKREARTASEACTGSGPSIWFFQDHQWKQRHDPSFKQQASSVKHHAPIFRKRQASSAKLREHQATSFKRQATSFKLQAGSDKLPDPGTTVHGYWRSIRGTRTKGLYHDKCIFWMS